MSRFLSKLTLFSLLLLATISFSGSNFVMAQEMPNDIQTEKTEEVDITSESSDEPLKVLKEKIKEMKKYYLFLKEQFLAGEITRDEALSLWNNTLLSLREEKKNIFDEKMNAVKEKFSEIKEKNPELADKLQKKYEEVQERRAEISLKMKEISDKVESGEITREEAIKMRTDYILEYITKNKELRDHDEEEYNDDKDEMNKERKEYKERMGDDDHDEGEERDDD